MKYCIHCGAQLPAEAQYCSACGKLQSETNSFKYSNAQQPKFSQQVAQQQNTDTLGKVGFAFMIVSDVIWGIMAFYSILMILGVVGAFGGMFYFSGIFYIYAIMLCVPLFWCIPMTVSLSKKLKNNQPISVGFKVCTLIFVNIVSGIVLLCRKEEQ